MSFLNFPCEAIVKKAWGEERVLVNLPHYCAKLLIIHPGWRCSEHRHLKKNESFIVLDGSCVVGVGHRQTMAFLGHRIDIPVGTWHWFGVEGPAEHTCTLLEVSTHHDDADVERRRESEPFKFSTSNIIARMQSVP